MASPRGYPHYFLLPSGSWANWEAARRQIERDLDRGDNPTIHHHHAGEECNESCAVLGRDEHGITQPEGDRPTGPTP